MLDEFKRKIRRIKRKRKSTLFVGAQAKKEALNPDPFEDTDSPVTVRQRTIVGKKSLFDMKSEKGKIALMDSMKSRRKSVFWKWFKIIFWVGFDLGLVIGLALLGWIFYVSSQAPDDLEDLLNQSFQQSSVIYDGTGKIRLYTLTGDENRKIISIDKVSTNMQNAMVAAEDADFWTHTGVDTKGILRSLYYGLKEGRTVGGGSTITQQVVKMLVFPDGEESFKDKVERKIKEITIARKLEKKYGKEKILETYLNKANFIGNVYGVEQAAQVLFQKSALELSIAQSAVLAGLPQAPGRYTNTSHSQVRLTEEEVEKYSITSFDDLMSRPYSLKKYFKRGVFGADFEFAGGKTDRLPGRFDYVLNQMKSKGFITAEEFEAAQEEAKEIEIKQTKRSSLKAPHFVFFVEDELDGVLTEKYGEDYGQIGGLKIYTTLDYRLQEKTIEILKTHGETNEKNYNIRNGAVFVMDPNSGAIKVMQGSRDYFATEINDHDFDGEVNVLTSQRQPGSTFKPIAYAAAFEYKGLSPGTVLMDVETNFGSNGKEYTPRNYDGKFHGPLSIRKALGHSYNIPAVKAGIIASLQKVHSLGELMGIKFSQSADHYGASFSLGSAELQPVEMGQAFSTFANGGKRITPRSISKIIDANGDVIYEYIPQDIADEELFAPVIQPETAFLITDILSDTTARPTSWSNFLSLNGRPSAAKTGTSTGYGSDGKIHPHDAWTIGYTPQLLTVVWTGNNKGWEGNKFGLLADNASGLSNAAPIWRDVMNAAHEGVEVKEFTKPEGIRKIKISKLSGKMPPENFPDKLITSDYFNTSYLPDSEDQTLKIIELVEASKLLPNEYTPVKALKKYVYIALHSYFPNRPNWENPVKKWVENNRQTITANLGVRDIIPYVPTQVDNTYEPDAAAPEIKIISPPNLGIVAAPSVSVTVDPDAPRGVSVINFYWDDTLVASKKQAPWTVTIPISGAVNGSKHVIRAEVIDRKYYLMDQSVQVQIGDDRTPPQVSFRYPTSGDVLEAGTLVQISADAIDAGSAIKEVEFFLDGNSLKTRKQAPFAFSWTVDAAQGNHTLTATAIDQSGNSASTQTSFTVAKSTTPVVPTATPLSAEASTLEVNRVPVSSGGTLAITSPSSGSKVSGGALVSFFVPAEYRNSSVTTEVVAKLSGGRRETAYTITGNHIPSSGKASFQWNPDQRGVYDLTLKIHGIGAPEFSKKVRVTAE